MFLAYPQTVRWVLLLRLLKLGRIYETINVGRKNCRSSFSMAWFFIFMFALHGILIHLQACGLGWIGRRYAVESHRFDGKSLFKDFESKPYVTLGPILEMEPIDQYSWCFYLAGQVMQAVSYGDAVPYALGEQVWVMFFGIVTNANRAFLMIKLAKYLGCVENQKIEKI
jgi:hypothetical protein